MEEFFQKMIDPAGNIRNSKIYNWVQIDELCLQKVMPIRELQNISSGNFYLMLLG